MSGTKFAKGISKGVNAAMIGLVAMLLGPDALGSPDAMLAWGGSFGPRTTGDERWRVLTSIFVLQNTRQLSGCRCRSRASRCSG